MPFEFPFDRYKGHDLVVWGQRERIARGDMEGGLPWVNDITCPSQQSVGPSQQSVASCTPSSMEACGHAFSGSTARAFKWMHVLYTG